MTALAAAAGSGGIWTWLGGAVSASILTGGVLKIGGWYRSVNDRLDRHDRALRRIGGALTDDNDEEQEGR